MNSATFQTSLNQSVAITLTGNDPEGFPVEFTYTNPAHGTLSGTAPSLTYTPALNFSGIDSFDVRATDGAQQSAPATITLTVAAANHPPTAQDDSASTTAGVIVDINVLANDSDPDPGDTIAVSAVQQDATHGTATLNVDGTVRYQPQAGFTGLDVFHYTIADSHNATATAAVTVVVTSGTCAPAPGGIVSWWRGDGNGDDSIGGHNGTLLNGAAFEAGKIGQGFSFAHAGVVTVPDAPELRLTSVTLDAWISTNSLPVPSNGFAIALKSLTASSENYGFYVARVGAATELDFEWFNGGFHNILSTTGAALLAQPGFHHVAVTADGANVSFYVDGQPIGQSAQTSPLIPSAGTFQIGSAEPALGNRVDGVIDEVHLFNRALTAAEIQTIFTAGAAGTCPDHAPVMNLVGDQTNAEGEVVSVATGATDPDADTLTFGATGLPPALTINASSGLISGTLLPGSAGTYTVTVTASDGTLSSSRSFNWTVTPSTTTHQTTWIRDASGFWDDPVNWSGGAIPADGDDVVIDRPAGNFVVTVRTTTAAVHSLLATEPLVVTGSLVVGGSASLGGGLTLPVNASALTGTGKVTLTGPMNWQAGTITLGGGLEVSPGTTLTLDPNGGTRLLRNTSLRNHGTVAWVGNSLLFDANVAVINDTDGIWDAQGDLSAAFFGGTLGTETFTNAGLLRKSAGSGSLTFTSPIAVTNTGTIDVQSGRFATATMTTSGRLQLAAGTTLDLSNVTLQAGSTFGGSGTLDLPGTEQRPSPRI